MLSWGPDPVPEYDYDELKNKLEDLRTKLERQERVLMEHGNNYDLLEAAIDVVGEARNVCGVPSDYNVKLLQNSLKRFDKVFASKSKSR